MKNNYYLSAAAIFIFLAGGCSYRQYSYINHLPHDPAFEKGGELTGGVSPGIYGVNAQVSLSPLKYTGLTGGYTHDFGIGYGYNYGALLYVPLIKKENNKLFVSFHFEQAEGNLDKRLTALYKSINLRPSVYGSFSRGAYLYKTGITAQYTTAHYQRLLVEEDEATVMVSGASGTSRYTIRRTLADARDIDFTGNGVYGFIEISHSKSGIGGALYLGAMPHRHNFWQVGSAPVHDKTFQFSQTFFFMLSLKYRLQLY